MKVSEAYTIDVKALDMETKKVVTFPTVPCPNCGKWILVNHNHRFCEYCGEQLEWEESGETDASSN